MPTVHPATRPLGKDGKSDGLFKLILFMFENVKDCISFFDDGSRSLCLKVKKVDLCAFSDGSIVIDHILLEVVLLKDGFGQVGLPYLIDPSSDVCIDVLGLRASMKRLVSILRESLLEQRVHRGVVYAYLECWAGILDHYLLQLDPGSAREVQSPSFLKRFDIGVSVRDRYDLIGVPRVANALVELRNALVDDDGFWAEPQDMPASDDIVG